MRDESIRGTWSTKASTRKMGVRRIAQGAMARVVGDDYIELAYKTARQADPKALLTYNDYGIEYAHQEEKREAVLAFVRRMKAPACRSTRWECRATSMRAGAAWTGLQKFVREMAKLDLQVFVTELDVNDKRSSGTIADRDAAVAKVTAST